MSPALQMGVVTEATASQLLDFSQRLDIDLLDRVVNCMYHDSGTQQKMAEKILNTLKEHPDAWMRVDSILEYSSNQETKYFALQILEALIKTRWKVLARPQCEGIKKYIVGLIIQTSSNSELIESEKTFLSKLNMILVEMLPLEISIIDAYENGTNDEQNFVQNLAIFYTTFLKWHSNLVEKDETMSRLSDAYQYLLMLSEVEEREVFKICLEYWNVFVADLYRDMIIAFGSPQGEANESESRQRHYAGVLSKLRRIMISRMARPEEVLVVENEHGEVVREFMKDTDSLNLYKSMRETLVYLTHLDHSDTKKIMIEKLENQVNGTEWSWHNLNTLCWAIGSISGAMLEDDERSFLVIVIRDLLGLCEQKRGKDNKAIVASNIMYVVGQYPRFLRAHWRFLRTVITKLFEFMHETHEGVQDMACDTFIKIAQRCRRQLVTVQSGETNEFIEDILKDIDFIIDDLQPQQVHTFYEAIGIIISGQPNTDVQALQVKALFRLPNRLGSIYLDILNVYKIMSQDISQAVSANGVEVTKQPLIKGMRSVRKAILNLLIEWFKRAQDPAMIAENFVPPLLDAVADDYQRNFPSAREPEVLNLMTELVNRLKEHILLALPRILDAVFQSTLEMIDKNLEEYPEHRTNFFFLLQVVNSYCFSALLGLTTDKFKLVLDSVIWAIKHTMRQVSETGLSILHVMLTNIAVAPLEQRRVFFKTFFMDIMQHMFAVITDRSQTGNLSPQSALLTFMFTLLENGCIDIPLADNPNNNNSLGSNVTEGNVLYVHQSLSQLLKQVFPHLQNAQLRVFIDGLFSFDHDPAAFREHIRDFLVEIRQVAGEDLSDLYLEEREAEIARAQATKLELQASVPGIFGPHEVAMEREYVD